LSFFEFFLGYFSSILGFSPVRGGLFEKVNSAFDRARRVLSWSTFGLTWSNSQANRPWKYSNPPVRYPTSILKSFGEVSVIDVNHNLANFIKNLGEKSLKLN
jgi:hypothetical protein